MSDANSTLETSVGSSPAYPPNLDDIYTFLQLLEPDVFEHEFCWFKQYAKDGPIKQRYALFNEDTIEWLIDENNHHQNIFVCINAIDVPAYDGDYPKRRKTDVTRVRAVFGDFDDPKQPLPEFTLPPSLLVQTSPGKHHAYWLTRDTPLDRFEQIQLGIIDKYKANGSDKTIRDLSRVMRLPGLWHMKNPREATRVRLLDAPGHGYAYADLMAEFPAPAEPQGRSGPTLTRPPLNVLAEAALAVAMENGKEIAPGKVAMECPWADGHTTGRGGAAYFVPSNLNGGRGGFKCMHAHCAERTITDFAQFALDLCVGTGAAK